MPSSNIISVSTMVTHTKASNMSILSLSTRDRAFSKSKFETKVLNILELIHKNNGKRGVFELLRTTINSKILEDAEKRAEKQKRK